MTVSHLLKHPDANIHITPLEPGRFNVAVEALNGDFYIHQPACRTAYPLDLIRKILDGIGPAFLCDEIMREESPDYVQNFLYYDLLGYVAEDRFKHKTLLDFGCGSGASTMILTRMFPETRILGVELEERLLAVARARAEFYRYGNLQLLASPDPNDLPAAARELDFVVLSGVFEHLLPEERRRLLPRIWERLKPGGILFLNQTPHRGFPVEFHTTGGLPLINYLPDAAARWTAQKFSKRNLEQADWPTLLRMGIRGGSIREIRRTLPQGVDAPIVLTPSRLGLKDRLDLWYIKYRNLGNPWLMRGFYYTAKTLKRLTGITLLPNLALALQKPSANRRGPA